MNNNGNKYKKPNPFKDDTALDGQRVFNELFVVESKNIVFTDKDIEKINELMQRPNGITNGDNNYNHNLLNELFSDWNKQPQVENSQPQVSPQISSDASKPNIKELTVQEAYEKDVRERKKIEASIESRRLRAEENKRLYLQSLQQGQKRVIGSQNFSQPIISAQQQYKDFQKTLKGNNQGGFQR